MGSRTKMLEDRSQNGRCTEILRCETCVRSLASRVNFSSFRSQKRLVKRCVLLTDGDSPKNMRREVQQHGEKQPGDGERCAKVRERLLHLRSMIPEMPGPPVLRQNGHHCGFPRTTMLGGWFHSQRVERVKSRPTAAALC